MLKYFTMFFDKCKHILKRNKSEFIGFLFGLILFSFLVVRYLSFQKPSNPPERNELPRSHRFQRVSGTSRTDVSYSVECFGAAWN